MSLGVSGLDEATRLLVAALAAEGVGVAPVLAIPALGGDYEYRRVELSVPGAVTAVRLRWLTIEALDSDEVTVVDQSEGYRVSLTPPDLEHDLPVLAARLAERLRTGGVTAVVPNSDFARVVEARQVARESERLDEWLSAVRGAGLDRKVESGLVSAVHATEVGYATFYDDVLPLADLVASGAPLEWVLRHLGGRRRA